jgi:hypothetical protein
MTLLKSEARNPKPERNPKSDRPRSTHRNSEVGGRTVRRRGIAAAIQAAQDLESVPGVSFGIAAVCYQKEGSRPGKNSATLVFGNVRAARSAGPTVELICSSGTMAQTHPL